MFNTLGAWKVSIVTGAMPQKVATAIGSLAETLLGATYTPIAYLGSQLVNGTNHAILAEQTIVAGVDHKNIVLLKFNEKGMDCSLYAIEPVLQEGGPLGGVKINASVDIPEAALEAFNKVTANWVGVTVNAAAFLGQRVSKGTDYYFLASVTPIYPNAEAKAMLICVNPMLNSIDFTEIL